VLFGASTGRDGIGGASVLASAELDEADASKRPSVQVGDPFAEKKLLECSLELLERGLLVALQDLGAAGLSSSSAEMASKGEIGQRERLVGRGQDEGVARTSTRGASSRRPRKRTRAGAPADSASRLKPFSSPLPATSSDHRGAVRERLDRVAQALALPFDAHEGGDEPV